MAQKNARVPSQAEREDVLKKTIAAYWGVRLPSPLWIRNGLDREQGWKFFTQCLDSLEPTAGSGVPYASWNGRRTHADWFLDRLAAEELFELVWARLTRMLVYSFSTPEAAVQDGICDPVRVFVKGEPHKVSKLLEGRYRLIASVSLVDQLVARMLFQEQNKRELVAYQSLPSQPGMGLSTDDQVEEFTTRLASACGSSLSELFEDYRKWVVPTDCSGFDWSVPDWLLQDDMEVRNALTIDCAPELAVIRDVWLSCICNSVFCLSDGTLLSQTTSGIQKSGSYNTSSSNSRVRFMMSLYAGAPWCFAMGDDAIEGVGTNLARYGELGFKCEEAESFDFCSHVFRTPRVALPVNSGRMLFRLLCGHSPDSPDASAALNWYISFFSVLQALRHLPAFELAEILCAFGLDAHTLKAQDFSSS